MAIYAFDGTGNEDNPGIEKDSNVSKFFQTYVKTNPSDGNSLYLSGVGTRYGKLGEVFGSLFGAGGEQRVQEALDRLEGNFEKGDERIDIVGFSRGAALALEFANEIHENQFWDREVAEINFIGLWDTVASFGIPGNSVNLGYTLTVPPNVRHCSHALALDERRQFFPLTRVFQDRYTDMDPVEVHEVWFRGFHSDVGGGNENQPLSNISLAWMIGQAMRNNIAIAQDDLDYYTASQDPEAPCRKPGMDKIPNKKRTIQHNDLIHESIGNRTLVARNYPANNPAKGMTVMTDSGDFIEDAYVP